MDINFAVKTLIFFLKYKHLYFLNHSSDPLNETTTYNVTMYGIKIKSNILSIVTWRSSSRIVSVKPIFLGVYQAGSPPPRIYPPCTRNPLGLIPDKLAPKISWTFIDPSTIRCKYNVLSLLLEDILATAQWQRKMLSSYKGWQVDRNKKG